MVPSLLAAAGSGDFSQLTCNQLGGNSTLGLFALALAAVVIPSDANYNETAAQQQCPLQKITSSVSLTATRNVVLPLVAGAVLWVMNATTGGQSLQFIGASGTGATVANGVNALIWCDGTNWYVFMHS